MSKNDRAVILLGSYDYVEYDVVMQDFFAAALAQERLLKARVASSIGDNLILNRAIEIIFDLSTCRSRCRMGDHRLESLLGRALNQAVSGIMIDAAGFHDEALSLVRNIGEIANLFALFLLNPHSFDDWSGLEEKCRKKRFSAVHVRIAIEKQGKIAVPMDEQTYGRLSEQFVHIGSSTVPNAHDVDGLGHIGGKVQNNGTAEFQKELTYIVTHIALSASSLFKRQDFRSQLADLVILERATN